MHKCLFVCLPITPQCRDYDLTVHSVADMHAWCSLKSGKVVQYQSTLLKNYFMWEKNAYNNKKPLMYEVH